ncbi:ATP-binding cassette domain-containing protein, partial [Klebsiella pneumoniae]
AGLEEISGGDVHINERNVTEVEPKLRDIAMVFQSYALYPQMTVRENMGFALKMAKLPKAEINQKVNEAAALLGLEPLLERLPKDL